MNWEKMPRPEVSWGRSRGICWEEDMLDPGLRWGQWPRGVRGWQRGVK